VSRSPETVADVTGDGGEAESGGDLGGALGGGMAAGGMRGPGKSMPA
jgi:hypothetical protein